MHTALEEAHIKHVFYESPGTDHDRGGGGIFRTLLRGCFERAAPIPGTRTPANTALHLGFQPTLEDGSSVDSEL